MNPTPASESPANRLRLATWPSHQRIEQCGLIKRLFSKNFQLGEYAALLQKVYGFYSVVEPLLPEKLSNPSESAFRRPPKSSLLVSDLEELGRWLPVVKGLAVCQPPLIETIEDAIGVSYVLEGATNGGIPISKHLAGHFGEAVEASLGFYRSYGEATLPNWTAFKDALNQRFADDEAGTTAIIRAADATFLSFIEWLEQAP